MRRFKVSVNGVTYNVEVQEEGVSVAPLPARSAAPAAAPIVKPAAIPAPAISTPAAPPVELAAGDTPIAAPMPGKVTKVNAKVGDKVKKGDILMILEAMKMQNEIGAPVAGTVKSINVTKGQGVKPGEVMAVIG